MTEKCTSFSTPIGPVEVHTHPTDVLVVGGGLAGCWAAHRASERGRHVTVVDKSRTGAGGASPFAGAVILYMGPDDDIEAFLSEQMADGEGLADARWIRRLYHENYERIQQLDDWGAPMERGEDGRPKRRQVNIGSRKTVQRLAWNSVELMKFFYRHLKRRRHRAELDLIEQTPVVALLHDDERVTGAVGLNRQEDRIVVFPARSVVLAAGGCGFKGNHFALDSLCGEALDMALEVGGRLSSMEFSNGYIATCRHINTHGQSVLAAIGGKYLNGNYEPFLHRYTDQQPAPIPVVCRAMAREVQAGRGPIYYDLREIDRDLVDRWKDTFFLIQRLADRKGIDLFEEPLEWYPGMTGTIGASGGIWVEDKRMSTGVPGLFAAGDAASKVRVVGAGSGITFLNLAWAQASGYWAGEGAAREAKTGAALPGEGTLPPEARPVIERLVGRLDGAPDADIQSRYRRLQQQVMPADVSLTREPESLKSARSKTGRMLEQTIPGVRVGSLRDLARWAELRASARCAHAMLESALYRTESRGWHYRFDRPERNDEDWLRWTRLESSGSDPGSFDLDTVAVPEAARRGVVGEAGG